jgi:allantoin racemase
MGFCTRQTQSAQHGAKSLRLTIVNPNTTASMTRTIAAAATRVARPGTLVRAVEPDMGPASIEGPYDGALAVPGLLKCIAEDVSADAFIIACFDDTGLDAARALSPAPVVGIGEAAYHMASLIAGRFTVVTTLARAIPTMEDNLERYGLRRRCARVRACEVPVLELENPGGRARIAAEIERALAEDGCDAVVLGCAGMADFAAELSAQFAVPVIDGVAAAVALAEAVATLGLRTSKRGAYATPRPKPYAGVFAGFAPKG